MSAHAAPPGQHHAQAAISLQPPPELAQLVLLLTDPSSSVREASLTDLSKKREEFPDLAPLLWHSCGTVAALLQEIISIYPSLSPPTLTGAASTRVCNALALLQCVASHPESRNLFLEAHIPLYLYPFLSTVSRTKPFEYLRLTSLGVIGALVKVDDADVVNFLLKTEMCGALNRRARPMRPVSASRLSLTTTSLFPLQNPPLSADHGDGD
jgi:hypothetical protein